MNITVSPLTPSDRSAWEPLMRALMRFYERSNVTDADYDTAWSRMLAQHDVFGLAARIDGQVVGLAHYLFHTSVWAPKVCYLQDLFTSEAARGQGVGRSLIEAVARKAVEAGCVKYYWLTQEHNATARVLYDKVAQYQGFIRYDYPLPGGGA